MLFLRENHILTPIFLTKRREVSFEEGLKLAETNGLDFIETSAKTGENIEQAFGIATSNVLKKIEVGEINPLSDVFLMEKQAFYLLFLRLLA